MPWPAVRSAWAVSMTEVEEGRLTWDDTTQWALNRVSSSQIAVLNSQNVSQMESTSTFVHSVLSKDVLCLIWKPSAQPRMVVNLRN